MFDFNDYDYELVIVGRNVGFLVLDQGGRPQAFASISGAWVKVSAWDSEVHEHETRKLIYAKYLPHNLYLELPVFMNNQLRGGH